MTAFTGEVNPALLPVSFLERLESARQQKAVVRVEMTKTEETLAIARAELVMALSNVIRSLVDPGDPAVVSKLAEVTGTAPGGFSMVLLGGIPSGAPLQEVVSRLLAAATTSHEDVRRINDLLAQVKHLIEKDLENQRVYSSASRRVRDAEVKLARAQHGEAERKDRERLRVLGRPRTDSPPCAVPDAAGYAYKPDPITAATEKDFVQALRELVVWAGNPGLREISRRCGGMPTHSSFSKMLNGSTVPPKFEPVRAFITALGLEEKDIGQWMTAWRRFTMPVPHDHTAAPWASWEARASKAG